MKKSPQQRSVSGSESHVLEEGNLGFKPEFIYRVSQHSCPHKYRQLWHKVKRVLAPKGSESWIY